MRPKEQRALEALLSCRTQKEAAAMAGITEKTLSGYLRDDEFQEEYRRAVRYAVEETARALRTESNAAVGVLSGLAQDDEVQPQARISAARALLEMSLRFTNNGGETGQNGEPKRKALDFDIL